MESRDYSSPGDIGLFEVLVGKLKFSRLKRILFLRAFKQESKRLQKLYNLESRGYSLPEEKH